jgi:hypothetical protein
MGESSIVSRIETRYRAGLRKTEANSKGLSVHASGDLDAPVELAIFLPGRSVSVALTHDEALTLAKELAEHLR